MTIKRPPPPPGLPPVARRTWTAIVGDYPPQHFSAANLVLLEQFCKARALVVDCDAVIAKAGLILEGKAHPLLAVRAAAWSEMRALATKLRLAVSSTMPWERKAARPDPNAALEKPWE